MKVILIIILVLVAIACAVLGLLAAADPEGRGGRLVLILWGAAIVAFCGALGTGVWL
jgi:hypothetical protein